MHLGSGVIGLVSDRVAVGYIGHLSIRRGRCEWRIWSSRGFARQKVSAAQFRIGHIEPLLDELVDFGGLSFEFLLGGGTTHIGRQLRGADQKVFDLFKGREGNFADLQAICGIAVVLLILLFLNAKVENALHRGGVVAWGGDALTGAELGESFVLLTAERLETAQ